METPINMWNPQKPNIKICNNILKIYQFYIQICLYKHERYKMSFNWNKLFNIGKLCKQEALLQCRQACRLSNGNLCKRCP